MVLASLGLWPQASGGRGPEGSTSLDRWHNIPFAGSITIRRSIGGSCERKGKDSKVTFTEQGEASIQAVINDCIPDRAKNGQVVNYQSVGTVTTTVSGHHKLVSVYSGAKGKPPEICTVTNALSISGEHTYSFEPARSTQWAYVEVNEASQLARIRLPWGVGEGTNIEGSGCNSPYTPWREKTQKAGCWHFYGITKKKLGQVEDAPYDRDSGIIAGSETYETYGSIDPNFDQGPEEDEKTAGLKAEAAAACLAFPVRYTVTWDLHVSDTEAILEPPDKFDTWLPNAGMNERVRGDVLEFKVHLQPRVSGGTSSPRKAKFKFELIDVSREKGTCLNWPQQALETPDLQMEPEYNETLKFLDKDGLIGETVDFQEKASVMVSCFDWGAHGKLKVTAHLENGQDIIAHVEGDESKRELAIPVDENNNGIADAWERDQDVFGKDPASDDDGSPQGDGDLGDGLTLYEEYRGFMEDGNHIRTDPKKKDLFIWNGLRGRTELGIALFELLSGLDVHRHLRSEELGPDRVINSNFNAKTHVVDQHGLRVVMGASGGVSQRVPVPGSEGIIGTPKRCEKVAIAPEFLSDPNRGYLAQCVAHELFHCCNVWHHGHGDLWDQFFGICQNSAGKQSICIYELDKNNRPVGRGSGITLIWEETGAEVKPEEIAPGFCAFVGQKQGEHSGDTDCVMRYNCAQVYVSQSGRFVIFKDGEVVGTDMCVSAAGTGVNQAQRKPEARYGDAAKGDCQHQICVNDRYH